MATIIDPRPLAPGQLAPGWTLPDLDDNQVSLEDFRDQLLIMNFWSAECPWSLHADQELAVLMKAWGEKVALATVACNANETLDLIRATARARGLPLVLTDPAGMVADLYGAAATPHLFVIDGQGYLRYQGALDDTTFRQRVPTRLYLRLAIEALLEGRLPDSAETPAYGCALVRFVS